MMDETDLWVDLLDHHRTRQGRVTSLRCDLPFRHLERIVDHEHEFDLLCEVRFEGCDV